MNTQEKLDDIIPNLKECLDAIIKKMPNIDMTIHIGGLWTKGKETPYLFEIDLDSLET